MASRLLAATILIMGTATTALAQAADPHAGHGAPGGAMDGMNMATVPKGITRRGAGPAEAALQGFSDALEVGNRDLAIVRLAPDVRIVENGTEEDLAAYVGGHLASDIEFQKTVRTILLERQVRDDGAARQTIVSKSRLISNRSDKPVDIVVTETATMTKRLDGWRIARLEWQSAGTPPATR